MAYEGGRPPFESYIALAGVSPFASLAWERVYTRMARSGRDARGRYTILSKNGISASTCSIATVKYTRRVVV